MKNNPNWFFWLILIIPLILVFHPWFTLKPICSGDCLYFYPQSLKSFFDFPFVWDNRGGNSGLGSYTPMFLYMYFPSLIAGFLYQYFQITYNISEKIVWFFPFLAFSVISIYYLAKVLNLSKIAFIFSVIFYLLNTYILLVADGGQVGIALAYAIFPLSLALFIKSLSANYKSKILAGLALALLGVFDIRIASLAIGTFIIYGLFFLGFEKKPIKVKTVSLFSSYLSLVLLLLGIHFYWILPTIIGGGVSETKFIFGSLEHTESLSWMNLNHLFFVFQPHWSQNVFGKLNPIQFEFFLIPIFVFLPLVFRKINYRILCLICLALVFTFLAKGFQEPLSGVYEFLFEKIPGFSFFRDPSKFLIPQLTAYSFLFGISISTIYQFLKKPGRKIAPLFLILSFVYILILIRAVFSPGLGGTFRPIDIPQKYLQVKNKLENNPDYYRTLWYPSKDQFSYQDSNHPALSAIYDLKNVRPLNTFISGTYDFFSYLKNSFSWQFFDILGIRDVYVVDPLKRSLLSKSDLEDRERLEKNLNDVSWLEKQKESGFLAFENFSYAPRVFTQNKTFWLVGSDDLYRTFSDYPGFKLRNIGFVFLDEGQAKEKIEEMKEKKDLLVYNHKDNLDLAFLLLNQNYFYNALDYIDEKNGTGGWGKSSSGDLIFWRNILENRGFRNLDFDFGRGFTWTDSPAKISFPIKISKNGEYEIYLRFFANNKGSSLKISFDQNQYEIKTKDTLNDFIWQKLGEVELSSGNHQLQFESERGFNIVNVFAVVPKTEIRKNFEQAKNIENRFETIYIINIEEETRSLSKNVKPGDYGILLRKTNPTMPTSLKINGHVLLPGPTQWSEGKKLKFPKENKFEIENIDKIILYPGESSSFNDFLENKSPVVNFEYVNPTRYKVKIENPTSPFMLVFSENFNNFWKFKVGGEVFNSVPLYSTINGFNVARTESLEGEIVFNLQKYIYPGILISVLVLTAAIIILIL